MVGCIKFLPLSPDLFALESPFKPRLSHYESIEQSGLRKYIYNSLNPRSEAFGHNSYIATIDELWIDPFNFVENEGGFDYKTFSSIFDFSISLLSTRTQGT